MSSADSDIKKASYELMLRNRRTSGKFQYTVPSPDSYPYQWLWDSCFHTIILSHFNIDDAKKELLSLVSKQFENGLLPHMIYWEKQKATDLVPVIQWGKEDTSTITQPPMLAYSVWEIYKKDKDTDFLVAMYESLVRFYKYLLTERDPRGNHLAGIINPDESGEDNSPRFDIPLGNLPPRHSLEENSKKRLELVEQNRLCKFDARECMRNFFWVKDVPFNAILVKNLNNMAYIAKELGKSEDVAYFEEQQLLIATAMRKYMYEDGLFWSTYGREYRKIKVKTWAIFAPLFANMLTQEEAETLVNDHLLNSQEFKGSFWLPTVAMDEPSFDPNGFWRGPIWMAINWFVYKGLMLYGFSQIAHDVKESSIRLLQKSGFREHFNPHTGKGQGAKDFTWGGLIADMEK